MTTTVPGLIDLQVNGAMGWDLTAEPERLWDVAAALPRFGVTAFVPTVITSAPAARERALAALAGGPPVGWRGARPLGWHFEGPMLAQGRKGAHLAQWLAPPSLDLVEHWSREAGVVIVTLAPELPGALDVIEVLVDRGVVVSIGHTEATTGPVAAAVGAGASLVTHLGNAMPPLTAREPGPMGLALAGPHLVAGVIADGVHLAPATLRLAWRTLGERFLTVTDATAALGLPDGPTRLGDQDVVLADGAVRLLDGTLAGSAASLPDCLRVIVEQTGATLEEAVASCTTTPARLLGLQRRDDHTVLDDDLSVVATIVDGETVWSREA